MTDLFDEPLSVDERAEVAAMPSHELYLLTCMVPPTSVRGRIVNELYAQCRRREQEAGLGA